ncbi:MAG: (2Fe-2S)-binding protein [Clostridia bacterium]|nr:(2Fe-2S)-binding protein [Clostridia bacterium]
MDKEYMIIDGIKVELNGEKNILEVARKAGIDIPAFCYDPDLSIYGACRMCLVENERGGLDAACSTPPRAGTSVKTNTPKLRKHRKMILELLLANHCRDCTTCQKSGKCKLQEFAYRFNIEGVRFPNTACELGAKDKSSLSIVRDSSKCILCGKCVRVCNEIQNVGAIDYAFRGSKMKIATAFDGDIVNSPCVGCGQCASVCPTGAITVRDDADKVWDALGDKNTEVSVQIAPAVRVALGKELGLKEGENLMGKLVASLKEIGFDKVYDTSLTADMTIVEEAAEFVERLNGKGKLPMFTSCCPAWIRFAEEKYPEYVENISTCRSPMQMFAPVIKETYTGDKKHIHVAIMPCTAKKFEASRDEFKNKAGEPYVDYVLTTQEVIRMIKESGVRFNEIADAKVDEPYGMITGAGVIFGVTGGVMEAVLRYVSATQDKKALDAIALSGVRGLDGVKEATVKLGDAEIKVAVVSGLANASALMEKIKNGEAFYHLVEVMSCPGGCINGGGQPVGEREAKCERTKGIYDADKAEELQFSNQNTVVKEILTGPLKGREHELLHVHYKHK